MQLKLIDFNARDKGIHTKKESFYRLVNNSMTGLRQFMLPSRSG